MQKGRLLSQVVPEDPDPLVDLVVWHRLGPKSKGS